MGLILITLFSIDDHKAKIVIKSRYLPGDSQAKYPWKERFLRFLEVISVPDPIDQIVDNDKVIWAGIQMTHNQYVSFWWLMNIVGTLLGFLVMWLGFGNLWASLVIIFLLLSIVFGPYLYLHQRIQARKKEVERSLPDFLDMLTLNIEAGIGFGPALKRINNGISGVLKEEISRTLIQMDLGFTRKEALGELANRVPSMDLAHFVEAILISERLGTSLARTMRVQANLLRSRRRQRAEVHARTAPIRIIPALVFFFLPGLLLIFLAPPIINFLIR